MTRVCAAALASALAASSALGGAAPAGSAIGYAPSSPSLFLDEEWYRSNLIKAADLWNGGLDGEGGMGTYRKDFDGFFQVNLDRAWHPRPGMPSTSVAQSRAIYMNVEAYRAAGPTLTPISWTKVIFGRPTTTTPCSLRRPCDSAKNTARGSSP